MAAVTQQWQRSRRQHYPKPINHHHQSINSARGHALVVGPTLHEVPNVDDVRVGDVRHCRPVLALWQHLPTQRNQSKQKIANGNNQKQHVLTCVGGHLWTCTGGCNCTRGTGVRVQAKASFVGIPCALVKLHGMRLSKKRNNINKEHASTMCGFVCAHCASR